MWERTYVIAGVNIDSNMYSASLRSLLLCEQTPFAKFDAVELYLRKRCYIPGLTFVEKNTFRRFCRKFVIKGLYKPEYFKQV